MTILITGGLGYTGIQLAKYLKALNYDIIIVDLNLYRTKELLGENSRTKILVQDIRSVDWALLKKYHVDTVYHLAGISNDPGNGVTVKTGRQINFEASARLYDAALKYGIRKFIYPSSCSVYGDSQVSTVSEETTVSPLTEYALCKVLVENHIKTHKSERMQSIILRPATVFGPSARQRLDLLINKIIVSSLAGQGIVLPGKNKIRPSVYINDLVQIYLNCLAFNTGSATFNVAFGNRTIAETITLLSSHLDIDWQKIVFSESDSRSYRVSSEKLLKQFPTFKKTSTENAFAETINYFSDSSIDKKMNSDIFYDGRVQASTWGYQQ